MNVPLRTKPTNTANRINVLNRLSKSTPTNNNNNNKEKYHQRNAVKTPTITDARQLLLNRNKPVFDARQLLSRQSSKIMNTSLVIQRDISPDKEDSEDGEEQNSETISKLKNDRFQSATSRISFNKKNGTSITFQNPDSIESFSFTKTIINTSVTNDNDDRKCTFVNTQSASSDKKQNINFSKANDRKRPKSPSSELDSPPPRVKRLNDASIQTSSRRRQLSEDDDSAEPPQKRSTSRNIPKNSVKSTSSNNTKVKQKSSMESISDSATILITNLQPTVTENDLLDLFSEVGHIDEIKTLSRGCVQITYSKPESAKQAVDCFHNQLLDQQLIYVSLQHPSFDSIKPSKNVFSSRHSKSPSPRERSYSPSMNNNEYSKSNSKKLIIDPTFMRQALFNPTNSSTNPVQFQVKL